MNEIISEKLALLPSSPGVYKMYDAKGVVIYVGKAVSLKNRVRQYFQSQSAKEPKVRAMVAHIADFETILTANETEALTLESNLIKQYQPRYNILLKDDKHFPYVRVDVKQDFPRFEIVRRVKNDGARYLGPYLSGIALRDALNVVRDHFPVRHCKKDISKAIARRERPCLMYHIGKCSAPCTGNISREQYHTLIDKVSSFLDGKTQSVIQELTDDMQQASDDMDFERAARIRDSIAAIRALGEKQTAIANKGVEQDAFACCSYKGKTLVFALFVRGGKVVGTEHFSIENTTQISDDDENSIDGNSASIIENTTQISADDENNAQTVSANAEAMAAFLKQYYLEASSYPPEVLLYEPCVEQEAIGEWLSSLKGKKVQLYVPQRGEKRKLTELSYRNCMDSLTKTYELKRRSWERGEGALVELSGALGLEELPARLECFDNSHIRGRDAVSSMVVFVDGAPARSEYRRFRIQTAAEGDDYAAMREALTRRFNRAMQGDGKFTAMPDILVVDGGHGQLNIALDVLSSFGLMDITCIGLAERSNTICLPGGEVLDLNPDSAAHHLLERLRDEAHRFAITYHRSLRGKNSLYSVLDEIPGVGDKRKRALFNAFLTIEAIASADIDALNEVPGVDIRTANAVYEHFHKTEE